MKERRGIIKRLSPRKKKKCHSISDNEVVSQDCKKNEVVDLMCGGGGDMDREKGHLENISSGDEMRSRGKDHEIRKRMAQSTAVVEISLFQNLFFSLLGTFLEFVSGKRRWSTVKFSVVRVLPLYVHGMYRC